MLETFENYKFPVEDDHFSAPIRKSSEIKLIVVDTNNESIQHDRFCNLGDHLLDNDLLVFNDVGISPSRITAATSNGMTVDLCFLLSDPDNAEVWEVVVLAEGEVPLHGDFSALNGKIVGQLLGKTKDFDGAYWVDKSRYDGYRGLVKLTTGSTALRELLNNHGTYMHPWYANLNSLKPDELNPVMTRKSGGVLLSEPSRRISARMMEDMQNRGIEQCFISLWMSFSWNQATPDTDLDTYRMNQEEFEVSTECLTKVMEAKDQNRRVISIGTSGVRALESLAEPPVAIKGRTDVFIHPGKELRFCDGLLTNLHNSMGTHVIMASAFANSALIMEACKQAVSKNYYFGIHGDSMLVLSKQLQN